MKLQIFTKGGETMNKWVLIGICTGGAILIAAAVVFLIRRNRYV